MSNAKLTPDYLFEVSWEVCNKVGGIHTVISTKAQTATRKFADRYILIGPDLQHEGANPEFEEDPNMLKAWRQSVYSDGLRIRVGHWKIKGEPTVILVDFTSLIPRKDEILKKLWETYHVDSLSDDCCRRTPPAQTRPLCGHALHDARHGHGALHRR